MKELILGFLGPEAITMKAGRESALEVTDLVFHKDSRTLGVELTLNFVMPKEEEIPLEHAIMERLPEISGVEFRYRYVEPAEEEEAALKKYLPHMIARANGEFASLTSCIDIEDVRTEGNVFRVKALGHIACDQLNAKVAGTAAEHDGGGLFRQKVCAGAQRGDIADIGRENKGFFQFHDPILLT